MASGKVQEAWKAVNRAEEILALGRSGIKPAMKAMIMWCQLAEEFAEIHWRQDGVPICWWPSPFAHPHGGNVCNEPLHNFIELGECELRYVFYQLAWDSWIKALEKLVKSLEELAAELRQRNLEVTRRKHAHAG